MNGPESRIEIFKPFGEGFELMKKVLFQPFDIKKWFVIGFAAFLANLSGGFHFNFGTNWNRRNWRPFDVHDWQSAMDQLPDWFRNPIVIAIVIGISVMLIVLFAWLGAHGRFIFTDCVVKNRGAIVAPWHEFRKEANSFFLFTLLISFLFLIVAAVLALVFFACFGLRNFADLSGVLMISLVALAALIVVVLAVGWALISHFMVPVMYRRRCRAGQAFTAVASLVGQYPGEVVLYCLFFIVLLVIAAIFGCIALCATCCIAAIPYIGTVILLPIFVLFRAFSLCFLRQFGPGYDVWQGISPLSEASTPPPPLPPPLQV